MLHEVVKCNVIVQYIGICAIIIMYFKANLHIRYDLYVVNGVGFELRLLQSSFVGYICSKAVQIKAQLQYLDD